MPLQEPGHIYLCASATVTAPIRILTGAQHTTSPVLSILHPPSLARQLSIYRPLASFLVQIMTVIPSMGSYPVGISKIFQRGRSRDPKQESELGESFDRSAISGPDFNDRNPHPRSSDLCSATRSYLVQILTDIQSLGSIF